MEQLKNTLAIYKQLIFLSMLYIVCDFSANLVVYKIVKIGPGFFPGGIFIVPMLACLNDVITEIFGYRVSCIVIWLNLVCDYIFMFLIFMVLSLPSAGVFKQQHAYEIVFNPLFQISLASTSGILLSSFVNSYLLARFKILIKGRYFWLRSIGSSLVGEALVVLIAIPLGYLGIYNWDIIEKIMISDYSLRLCYALIVAFPANIWVNYLKRTTGLDAYDYRVSFNPFRFKQQ
jgi:uncharacterized integral membrane protein (TIGR00697 family)